MFLRTLTTHWKLLVLSGLICISGCNKYSESIIDLDSIEEIELSPMTSDVDIIPIKCSVPMDGIRRAVEYNDYIFMLGRARKNIYLIQKDTVVAILDAVGRGHGEYSYIEDFAYDEKTRVLYVNADKKFMKYNVPSMTFIESSEIDYSTIGMVSLNSDELLVNCSFLEEEKSRESYNGLCVVSAATGEIKRSCYRFGFYDEYCLMLEDLVKNGEEVLLPVGGVYENRILSLNTKTGFSKELDSFSFSSKWRVPHKLVKIARKKDGFAFEQEAIERNAYCDGCHFPVIVNSRLTYWCYPEENGTDRPIVIIKDGDKAVCRLFTVPGTSIRINPHYAKDNSFVKVIGYAAESIVTEPKKLSDFGREIYNTMKAQPFNNPILLSFTVDKGI